MKFLLLIPSVAKSDIEQAVASDQHPRMDYHVLQDSLRSAGHQADILDFGQLADGPSSVRTVAKRDRDSALALLGFQNCRGYDAIFSNGENVAIPLALLLRSRPGRRPGHVTIGHKPSTGKKRLFFRSLNVMREIDTMLLYSALQQTIVIGKLGIPAEKIVLFPFHADTRFYRPMPEVTVNANQICSAGLEWRDYPTLIRSVADQPELQVRLAAASPWSKHTNETEKANLPSHVSARRYAYNELRTLYAESSFVVVPLYDNDFQAGVTTLLEAMAMGKAVIITRTEGQTDVVIDGETGIYVPPGDADALRGAIARLRTNPSDRERIGGNARAWMEKFATIEGWAETISRCLVSAATRP